jgi:predicted N-formylglutamate amidohydrolase
MLSNKRVCRALVITCEHATNHIPEAFHGMFAEDQALLDSHRGFDAGALTMARALAGAFDAPLLAGKASRLLVDLNRSVGHPLLHVDAVRQLPLVTRKRILERHYQPYRTQVEFLVADTVASQGRAIHVSSHSFTPELNGSVRLADIGLLYDPSRPHEAALCARWKKEIARRAPTLTVRRNYPYAGWNDGLTTWLRGRLPVDDYLGIELELNQKHVAVPASKWRALRAVIIAALGAALIGCLDGAAAPSDAGVLP